MVNNKVDLMIDAVRELDRIIPHLTSFVRAITNNPGAQVKIGEETSTDGVVVTIKPSLHMANSPSHDRNLCDVRQGYRLLCPACERSEALFFDIFHELSHLLYESFAALSINKVTENRLREVVIDNNEFYNHLNRNEFGAKKYGPASKLAHYIHPYVGYMFMATEDYRVERALGEVRPGFVRMSWFQGEEVLETNSWLAAPDDAQVPVAVLAFAQGHDISGRFSIRVVEAVQTDEVRAILDNAPHQSAIDSVVTATELVSHFNKLGFFPLEDDENNEPDESGDQESEDGNEGNSKEGSDQGGNSDGSPDGSQEAQGQEGQEGLDDKQDNPSQGKQKASDEDFHDALEKMSGHQNDHLDDKIDHNILKSIINQYENFDEFSRGCSGLQVVKPGTWGESKCPEPSPVVVQESVMKARRVFSDSKTDRHVRNLKKGRVDPKSLGARGWSDDDRLFHKKIRAEGVSFEVCIAGDFSGSTHGRLNALIKEIMFSTGNLLHRVGVDFSMYGHTTGAYLRFGSGSSGTMQSIMAFKTVNQPWTQQKAKDLLSTTSVAGSLDGHNFEFYRKVLQRSRANRKLLIYFTDGQIPATNRSEEVPIVQREIRNFRRYGISVLVVAMETDRPKEVGMDTILVKKSTDLRTVLKEIERRIIP